MELWQLQQLQSLPLDIKIEKTKLRIKEWYEAFDGEVYVSFSGGKDSTVLLHIVRELYPNVKAVFVDTGLEYPEIRNFVKTIDNVVWVRPKMNFKDVIEKYGYPVISKDVARNVGDVQKLGQNCWAYKCFTTERGVYNFKKWTFLIDAPFKISNKCCDVMKKTPLNKIKAKPFIGSLACESRQRETQYLKTGCNAFDAKKKISTPLGFWTEQDILTYLKTNNVSYSSIYGDIIEDKGKLKTTGVDRTGCMFCMFGCHLEKEPNRFQKMKITHPQIYNYCMKPIEEGGLGLSKVLDYIGVKY
jgi:3'-phosphoadenosine 5'-phosphosulfate sulfotransferase (PAPS reductase)/FAD synthetase